MIQISLADEEYAIKQFRIKVLNKIYSVNAGHYSSNFSSIELIYIFYKYFVNVQLADFILSKPHAATTQYAMLHELGYISDEIFRSFCQYKSDMIFLPTKAINGINFGVGAVGQGLSVSIGMALGYKHNGNSKKIGILAGDGELNEGSMWEAIMFAGHNKIDNIILIIDQNGLQASGRTEDIISLRNVDKAMEAFAWKIIKINGHNIQEVKDAYSETINYKDGPIAIIAETVKGKGVKFMEGDHLWHRKKMSMEEYEQALLELNDE